MARTTKLREKILPAFIRAALAVIGVIPVSLRAMLGRICGFIASLLPIRENEVAALQMDLAVPESGGRKNLLAMFAGIGQSVLECLNVSPLLKNYEHYISCRDERLLQEMLADQRGVLVVASHLSNWDLMASYLVRRGFKVSAVGREAHNPLLQPVLERIRENSKMDTIWRKDPTASMKIFKRLRQGEMVGTLLDQDTEVPSVYVPFFGIPAKAPIGMIEIAKRAGARIAAFLFVRVSFQAYQLRIVEFDSRSSVEEILRAYHLALEDTIREFPSQWMWVHKRWKSRPDRGVLRTKEYIEYLEGLIRERNLRTK